MSKPKGKSKMNAELACPECGSNKVAATEETKWMVNTGEHYCYSVKSRDADAICSCLSCDWSGRRDQLNMLQELVK